jgi:hypothetical protein
MHPRNATSCYEPACVMKLLHDNRHPDCRAEECLHRIHSTQSSRAPVLEQVIAVNKGYFAARKV